MSRPVYRLLARAEPIEVSHCTGVLMGSMQRFVLNKNIQALEEFYRIGIPLDFALDYAVQRGCMPVIDALLNRLGVVPSEVTLLRAVRRGVTIRNMFLDRVRATGVHLNAAVQHEHFDVAIALLDRGVEANVHTLHHVKPTAERAEERARFIDRLLQGLPEEVLNAVSTLQRLPYCTSVVQFERALDRARPLAPELLGQLLTETLRAAAPAHARVMLARGAIFTGAHRWIASVSHSLPSQSNPHGEDEWRLATVFRMAAETGSLFEERDATDGVARGIVRQYAFESPVTFLSLCELLARACQPNIRRAAHHSIRVEADRKCARSPTITREDLNALDAQIRPYFEDELPGSEVAYTPGLTP